MNKKIKQRGQKTCMNKRGASGKFQTKRNILEGGEGDKPLGRNIGTLSE